FSVTRWKDFPPTINGGLFGTILEEFPATTMMILSEKLQWYSYNHAWASVNGLLRVHHMKGNFEENARKGRKLVRIFMRHEEGFLVTGKSIFQMVTTNGEFSFLVWLPTTSTSITLLNFAW
ncbi:hypothetical protein KI387_020216, partial [Taxus chinensis]